MSPWEKHFLHLYLVEAKSSFLSSVFSHQRENLWPKTELLHPSEYVETLMQIAQACGFPPQLGIQLHLISADLAPPESDLHPLNIPRAPSRARTVRPISILEKWQPCGRAKCYHVGKGEQTQGTCEAWSLTPMVPVSHRFFSGFPPVLVGWTEGLTLSQLASQHGFGIRLHLSSLGCYPENKKAGNT